MKHIFLGAAGLIVVLFLQGFERPDVRFPRFSRDRIITWGILFTQNVSGLPAGQVDITAACPDGGSVHITGTLDASGTNADLNYDLDNCAFQQTSSSGMTMVSLALTGQVDQHMVVNATTGYGSVELDSQSLEMDGWQLNQPEEATVDLECPFSVTQVLSSISGAIMGKLCGRDTTWAYFHESCTL